MKKRFLYLALATVALVSCRKDELQYVEEVSIETQNSYDDEAAQSFLQTHYLDEKGNLMDYVATDTTHVKLASLIPAPVTLPSGVIYIIRPGAQPDPGTTIGEYDTLHLMSTAVTYVASKVDDKVSYFAGAPYTDNVGQSGVPDIDPEFYYVKKSVLEKATFDEAKKRSFYEIEGFQEGLKKFKAFDIPDASNYNMQGVIIVPSRAAYARDPHVNFATISYRNRSFIFNFQVYKSIYSAVPR